LKKYPDIDIIEVGGTIRVNGTEQNVPSTTRTASSPLSKHYPPIAAAFVVFFALVFLAWFKCYQAAVLQATFPYDPVDVELNELAFADNEEM
jgi:hypothetical protein